MEAFAILFAVLFLALAAGTLALMWVCTGPAGALAMAAFFWLLWRLCRDDARGGTPYDGLQKPLFLNPDGNRRIRH